MNIPGHQDLKPLHIGFLLAGHCAFLTTVFVALPWAWIEFGGAQYLTTLTEMI